MLQIKILHIEGALDGIFADGIEAFASLMENDLNGIFEHSATDDYPLNLRASLAVHPEPVIYKNQLAKLPGRTIDDWEEILNQLRRGGETETGIFKDVFGLRNSYKADFVTLLYGENVVAQYDKNGKFPMIGGQASLNRNSKSHDTYDFSNSDRRGTDPTKTYSIVRAQYVFSPVHAFVHELGHNFGLLHPIEFDPKSSENNLGSGDTGVGIYIKPQKGEKKYVTSIMGYDKRGPKKGIVKHYYSNPSKVVKSEGGIDVKLGSNKCNAVKHLQNLRFEFSNFRKHGNKYEPLTPEQNELLMLDVTVNGKR